MNKPHKRLIAWRKCMDLVVLIYKLTESFPPEEKFGLAFQMRKSAVSAPSNIAEGAAGRSQEQFRKYLSIAVGSLNELDTQLEIAFRVGFINQAEHIEVQDLTDEYLRTTFGLKRSVEQKIK